MHQPLNPGRLINTDARGFKLAVIVGFTKTGKVSVCKWSHNSKTWSLPQHLHESQIYPFAWEAITARHRHVTNAALASLAGGRVKHRTGTSKLSHRAHVVPPGRSELAPAGVTKLTTVIGEK